MGVKQRFNWLLGFMSVLIGLGLFVVVGTTNARADGSIVGTSAPGMLTILGTAPSNPKGFIDFKNTVPLFESDGSLSKVRRLAMGGNSWQTNRVLINLNNDNVYYRVTTSEYVKGTDVSYNDSIGGTVTVPLTVNYENHAHQQLKHSVFTVGTKQVAGLMAELMTGDPQVALTGYHFDKATEDVAAHQVTFTYNPTVTFRFQDTSGQKLTDDETVTGAPGDNYTVPDKSTDAAFKGYTLKTVQGGTPTGTYQNTPQMFTYIYAKAGKNSGGTGTSDSAGPVTVHYQTTAGTKLAADEVITGSRGTAYRTKAKTIAGYVLQRVIGKPTGKLTADEQTVTYVYAKAKAAAFKSFRIYGKQGLYRYAKPTFKRSQRLAHVKYLPRIRAKIFRVVGTATSSQGRLRYRLADGSYVTARADYVANLYWQGKHYRKLVVINPKGTYEYQKPMFKRNYRVKLLHKKTVVKVKRMVRRGDMTRYQLTNGRYLTGNKQWVSVK